SSERALLAQFGFPLTGTETRCYTNHALSYDQSKRVPRWVLEHISKSKITGDADRKHCKFKPDPNIPPTFSAFNEDYVGSGWSRGHMAPAGDNKFSSKAMAETFYLSNIVPQNFDNNAGYWNRTSDIKNICSVDTCKLLDFREFTLYLSTRKIEGARSVHRLEKVMENLQNAGIEPDEEFMTRYEKKLEELKAQEQSGVLEGKSS
ncbi:hypothetical protein E2I00_017561, partial [Balaenoptera physalus]